MKKKAIWLITTTIVTAALVLASCGPGATTTTPATTAPTGTTTAAPPPATRTATPAPGADVPKFGGTMTTAVAAGYSSFDLMKQWDIFVGHVQWTHNEPMGGDWTKGPQGSKQTNWDWGFVGRVELLSGEIAQSWELPDPTTVIWKLRQGVKFAKNSKAAKNAVVNGREMVANDWVWSLEQAFNVPTSWQYGQYPPGDPRRPTSFKALDKYTVEVKVPASSQAIMLLEMGGNNHIKAPELWTSTPPADNSDWRNIIGTGPWILNDYVDGSSITYVKNPDYWEEDPLHKGNRVPYADSVRLLIIPDIATRVTAIRTGRIDWLATVRPEDARQVLNQQKDLQSYRRIDSTWVLSGRQDKAPFNDIRVRRAMNLAVDQKEILASYHKGEGELLAYPFPPGPDWSRYFTPMDQLPAETQELWTYNPDKAKELLKEAGYPNGFKAEVIVTSLQPRPDEVSLLAGYLSKVGITLEIKVVEPGLYNSIDVKNETKDMYYGAAKGIWAPFEQLMVKKNTGANDAIIDDPYYTEVGTVIAKDIVSNPDNFFKTMKESGVHELSSAWAIWMPSPYTYNLWWPWLQNYHGIGWTGWADINDWIKFLWIDQNMKRSLGF